MHRAWTKSLALQATLQSYASVKEGGGGSPLRHGELYRVAHVERVRFEGNGLLNHCHTTPSTLAPVIALEMRASLGTHLEHAAVHHPGGARDVASPG